MAKKNIYLMLKLFRSWERIKIGEKYKALINYIFFNYIILRKGLRDVLSFIFEIENIKYSS